MLKGEEWDELKVSATLESLRRKQDLNRGISFPTIAAHGSNGAIIHYHPTEATNKKILNDYFFLLDSGLLLLLKRTGNKLIYNNSWQFDYFVLPHIGNQLLEKLFIGEI